MKQVFFKIFKIFLILAVVLLVSLLVFGLVLIIGWPWWIGFFAVVGILGLLLMLIFLKKILVKRSEAHFVHQVIEQDNSFSSGMNAKEKEAASELQGRWKEAIGALKSSHLKKQGNPLYVLPWYMVIGESGSGKTTAIKSARLSSPFAEVSKTSGISGTRNCDWWFFEQAILIDTAGRYAIPLDEGRDKDEWEKFLTYLVKFRKKEPINGLVVTVGADKLLQATTEELNEDGMNIRRRVDELMRVLGAKFPVYILVTKCDLIQGMSQFCDSLPENIHGQAMGVMNHDFTKGVTTFLERSVFSIGERLRDLRLLIFHNLESRRTGKGIAPGLLLFPEEFERLKSGITAFINGAFKENPYQESPILRGIFYSSGRQEGRPFSHFLNALGLIDERDVLPGTNRGLFLHDFFSRILPGDRKLFIPTMRTVHWNRLTRNLGLTSWVAIAIAVCGLLSFSFVKNLKTLRLVSDEFATPPVLQGEILTDASIMDRFREAIIQVEVGNRNWWIPRLGLYESIAAEEKLKARYCKQFKDGFLVSFDNRMADRVAKFSRITSKEEMASNIAHLVRRINLLDSRLKGEEFEMLQAKPQPTFGPSVLVTDRKLIPEVRTLFEKMNFCYLNWNHDSTRMNQEMNELKKYLKHALTLDGVDFDWIVTWANMHPSLSTLTLNDFWGGSGPGPEEAIVPAAYTLAGKKEIDAFLLEIDSALTDPLIIAPKKLEFVQRYQKQYVLSWHNFGTLFPQGANGLKSREEWQQTASKVAIGKGPYFTLLDLMTEELSPFSSGDNTASWMKLVFGFKEFKAMAGTLVASEKGKGFVSKVPVRKPGLLSRIENRTGNVDEGKFLESQLDAAKAVRAYTDALAETESAATSRVAAFQIASDAYKCEDPSTDTVPFFKAWNALKRYKSFVGSAEPSEEIFWSLAGGPLDCLVEFVTGESACHLQNLWEKEVMVEVQGVTERQSANQVLFGNKGCAVKFIDGPASPFLSRDLKRGYFSKKLLGRNVPFFKDFLAFSAKGENLKSGMFKDSYSVTIYGQPTDTKFLSSYTGPRMGVESITVELQCMDETRTLVNYNYPVRKTFQWSPSECSGVSFSIDVGKLVLTKKYTGYFSFPKFLDDFAKGHRIFYPGEFPEHKTALRRMGIKYIKVKYRFTGHQRSILKIYKDMPGRAPQGIVECWEQ